MLGARIASLRKKAGLSQAELAARLHVSPSTVGMYEQGRRIPNNVMLIALADEFHVTADYLLTGRCSTPNDLCSSANYLLESVNFSSTSSASQLFSREVLATLLAAALIGEQTV